MSKHWATGYIGKPWEAGASGPESFDCWGMVRHAQLAIFGRPLPRLEIGQVQTEAQLAALHALVRRSNWECQPGLYPMEEGDMLLMRSREGPHIGVVIQVNNRHRLLHAVGSVGSPGAVVHSSIDDVKAAGWGRFELWRHLEKKT